MLYRKLAISSLFRQTGTLLALSLFTLLFSLFPAAAQPGVYAWGNNTNGELGDDTTTNRLAPVQTVGLTNIIAISCGSFHSLALNIDGTVWAWGGNFAGELGDGTTTDRHTPIQINGLTDVIAVAGGFDISLALKSDGTVYAWGRNKEGQLGDGTNTQSTIPVQVKGFNGVGYLSGVIAIAVSDMTCLALKSDDTVWAWGNNSSGQLGDGTHTNRNTPAKVVGLTNVVAIAGGTNSAHNLALKSDGTVWAWGSISPVPVQISNLTNVIAIACGDEHNLALTSDGAVWAWGNNSYGTLGDGTTTSHNTPIPVSGLSNMIAIAGGARHSLAVKNDGTVWAWGANYIGQLGDGTTTQHNSPVQVSGMTGVVSVTCGDLHSLALVPFAIATVSGTITLDGITPSAPTQLLTLLFRSTDNTASFLRTVPINPEGTFSLSNIPAKNYNVWIKGVKWLAKVVQVDATMGNVSGVTATLLAGDADNNNVVDFDDLTILAIAYNTALGDALYDDRADFNCDGQVEFEDLTLLAINYNLNGDP